MKTIKNINSFAIGLPLLFLFIYLFNDFAVFLAMYSFLLTGIIQLILAIILLYFVKSYRKLLFYFLLVVLYFLGLPYMMDFVSWQNRFLVVFGIPSLIAVYLSHIIYKQH